MPTSRKKLLINLQKAQKALAEKRAREAAALRAQAFGVPPMAPNASRPEDAAAARRYLEAEISRLEERTALLRNLLVELFNG